MTLQELAKGFMTPARRKALAGALSSAKVRRIGLTNLAGSSAAMLLASLDRPKVPILVVGESADDAGYLYHDLSRLAGEGAVSLFPSGYKRDIKYGQVDGPSKILRTETLERWWRDPELRFVVSYPEALAEKVASREEISDHTLRLKAGATADLKATEKWLRENGFQEVDYVYEPGQWARRGSIVDIFGYSHELPYRLDFFGDEIETIRTFNIETQLSEERLPEIAVTPALEEQSGRGISAMEFMPPDTLVALRDAPFTAERIRAIGSEEFSQSAMIADEGDSEAMSQVVDAEKAIAALDAHRQLLFTAGSMVPAGADADRTIDFGCSPQALYHKNFDMISSEFTRLIEESYTIYILSDSEKQIERLRAIFADRGDSAIRFTPVIPTLHQGFSDAETHTCVFTDHQIFDRFHKYTLKSDRARSGKLALSLKELQQIEPGDYIVHVDHGVGRFAGLLRTNVNGRAQEMIKLVYANDDIIFVSIHALHKLAKYRGKEGVPPKVNKLGSGAWAKMKERTKSRLKDIARDLIKLYAARRDEPGFAFSPDSYLQHELEASFIYEDTPDQLTATQAVKADMERPRPMDRLVCGDVGFGKTEVAIRAAFKAATDGKQVAVLVPTTVLAYQHYNTFRERLKDFPVRVDYLSRARSAKQVKEILADLEAGKIDILIGTHKLIGKNVKFKDLGLLVIDEEQKFGVAVKERLKQLKVNVDTLTMSATPIPRTLQFSLMGARDLSSITTPPANRYPILTGVNTLSDDIVSEAINFELARNGQVFIINNRIEGLYQLEEMVKRLVPDARTLVAHGQMPPEKLEKAIIDFSNHDYDVLIATTIIESGIDMPNVNTIMINNAQGFGLSELHQLRGRVGRSSRKAFCYLMVPPGKPLTPDARRRLQAIESFSDLGSGIHIAMQDLDIRGAGNLLGAEQSGFIADLGYETYQKILKEAVTELRTTEFASLEAADEAEGDKETDYVADTVIESDLELLLPATYVPQESERIALYQELDSIDRELDLQAYRMRLIDRFGKIPRETEELLRIPRLRRMARRLGIEKVALKQGAMYVYFVGEENKAYYESPMFGRMVNFLQQNPRRVKIREKGGKRSFAIADVPDTETAAAILDSILQLNPI
ncbi:MAG: transcription-repair coupling factor [Candidatus Amulumruptor caecigallinarius]|nr:transcription-repair coupling factor [Candidatus Amulumruptor caecigallinarius]MCM1396510.1 transcription-repair coupling factor [Candidatus Amulumruptor caecigallinarius]MCM1453432.1 transcription-repair coupling factor [bacterium]